MQMGQTQAISTRRILIVDDEVNIREVLRHYLENEDFVVTEAGDGAEALRVAAAQPPDLVVLDLMLPGWMASKFAAACARRAPCRSSC